MSSSVCDSSVSKLSLPGGCNPFTATLSPPHVNNRNCHVSICSSCGSFGLMLTHVYLRVVCDTASSRSAVSGGRYEANKPKPPCSKYPGSADFHCLTDCLQTHRTAVRIALAVQGCSSSMCRIRPRDGYRTPPQLPCPYLCSTCTCSLGAQPPCGKIAGWKQRGRCTIRGPWALLPGKQVVPVSRSTSLRMPTS